VNGVCAFCERFQRVMNVDVRPTVAESQVVCHNCKTVWVRDETNIWHPVGTKDGEYKDD
jgi:hypothetical protein